MFKFIGHKCYFCGKRNKEVKKINYIGDFRYMCFHDHCLAEISCYPEKYTEKEVDHAIEIHAFLDYYEKQEKEKKLLFVENCEKLKNKCI